MNFGEIDNFMDMGQKGDFIKLEKNVKYELKILGIQPKQGKFGKQLCYYVLYNGEKKSFSSSSKRLWFLIKTKNVALGDTISLVKSGEGTSTNWALEVLDKATPEESAKLEKKADLPEAGTKPMEQAPMPTQPDQQSNGDEINLDDIPF